MTRGQRGPKRTTPTTSGTSTPTTEVPRPAPIAPTSVVPTVSKPLYLCSPFVEAALVKGNFKTIVMLPKYVDIMEWVAVNSTFYYYYYYYFTNSLNIVFDFYTNLNEFYGVITECCTPQACPTMSAGRTCVLCLLKHVIPRSLTLTCCRLGKYRLNYTWINHDRKSVNLAAPTYIDYVMTWIQNLLNDEATFPTKAG